MDSQNSPTAVLFDWDGTLVDTLGGLLIAHNHVRGLYGLPLWDEPEFMKNIKFSSREIYPKIYGDDAPAAMDTLYKFVMEHHLNHLEVLPDAEALVRLLHAKGIPVGIVSNKRHEVLLREIAHLGWQDMFYCALGAGQASRDKPAGAPIVMALERAVAPLDPASVWFVGDTETDLLAAAEAGCPAILVTHGKDRTELINNFQPFIVAADCRALINLLDK